MRGRLVAAFLAATLCCEMAAADTFGSGDNLFEIPFVTIGDPRNAPDTTGVPSVAGQVDYTYRIGKYEVPEEAITKANAVSADAGDPLGLVLSVQNGARKPATSLLWPEIARFVNWLNESKGHTPAYKFDTNGDFQLWEPGDAGYNPSNLFRNSKAVYVLPSTDEWYKAAFYDPAIGDYWDFPTGSNDDPIPVASGTDPGTAIYQQPGPADIDLAGGLSPYQTVGQGGNVNEWEESAFDLVNDSPTETRGIRGGDHRLSLTALSLSVVFRTQAGLTSPLQGTGFRIVRIPEPSSISLLLIASTISLSRRRNHRIIRPHSISL